MPQRMKLGGSLQERLAWSAGLSECGLQRPDVHDDAYTFPIKIPTQISLKPISRINREIFYLTIKKQENSKDFSLLLRTFAVAAKPCFA